VARPLEEKEVEMDDNKDSGVSFIAGIIISIVLAISVLYTSILEEKTRRLLKEKARVAAEGSTQAANRA